MKPPDRDRNDDDVDTLRDKLNEVLRNSREQLAATQEMRQAVRDIHHRVLTGGFPILRRPEDDTP